MSEFRWCTSASLPQAYQLARLRARIARALTRETLQRVHTAIMDSGQESTAYTAGEWVGRFMLVKCWRPSE
jgi:hypothetical protein